MEDRRLGGLAWDGGPPIEREAAAADAAGDWIASGAMELTGEPSGPPLAAPGEPASAARGATLALAALAADTPWASPVGADGARLLSERAALLGLRRRGSVSPNGSCRMVRAADGWLAVNMARPDDRRMLDAWLETTVPRAAGGDAPVDDVTHAGEGAWTPDLREAVDAACAVRRASELAARAALLGLAVAEVPAEPADVAADEQSRARAQPFPLEPWRIEARPPASGLRSPPAAGADRRPTVVDLSSLWAGPLCSSLLGRAGFEVVAIEAVGRPDPSRVVAPEFHRRLRAGHRRVVIDFADPAGVRRLESLMTSAAVVVEGSRPRALDQLGVGPAVVLARSPSTVWVSITGYGRTGPWSNRAAFGDDAAAAAGLVARDRGGRPLFCGDAIADPLTGLHAAVAAMGMLTVGVGGLVDVPLRDVAASAFASSGVSPPAP